MKIHADDCPALKAVAHWSDMTTTFYSMGVCTCTAQAALAKLVAAAKRMGNRKSYAQDLERLDAALKPFREEKNDGS